MGLQGQLDEMLCIASITSPEDEEINNPIWFQQDGSSQFMKLAGFRYVNKLVFPTIVLAIITKENKNSISNHCISN